MNKILVALLVVFSLVGCSDLTPEEQAVADLKNDRLMRISMAQIHIEKSLRDPDSVQYEFKAYNLDNDAMCFDYRAKNGFGGYANGLIVILADNSVLDSKKDYNLHCSDSANYEIY